MCVCVCVRERERECVLYESCEPSQTGDEGLRVLVLTQSGVCGDIPPPRDLPCLKPVRHSLGVCVKATAAYLENT